MMDLRKLARADTPDPAQIYAQIDKVAQIRVQMAKAHAGALLEARALLTPEQLKKWHAELPLGGEGDE